MPGMPLLPYDVFAAAEFFLQTGRSEAEVLARLGLSPDQWRTLARAYFDQLHDSDYVGRLKAAYPDIPQAELVAGLAGPRWQPPAEAAPLYRWARAVRAAVLAAPHIGPFADAPWSATFVLSDPVGWLRYFSHDGETLFHCGTRVADRAGVPVKLDVRAFRHLGGRWYTDGMRILGEGQLGGVRPRSYFWTLDNADLATFRALNLRYARDDARAWYITGKEIRTKSPLRFEAVPWVRLNYRDLTCDLSSDESHFARDAEHVYFYGARLKGARPASFRDLGHNYATDGATVWFLERKKAIDGADAASFIVPGPGEPYVQARRGGAAVTDRFRSYGNGEPVDPAQAFEPWRPFFEFRSDLADWWWHQHRDTLRQKGET